MSVQKHDKSTVRGVRFAQDRSRVTLHRILEAALGVFAEKGYNQGTVADIISRADIGHGTFWLYFKNKEDLVLYLLKEMVDQFEDFSWYGGANFEDLPATTLPEVEGIIREVMEIFFRYYSLHPVIVQASLESEKFREALKEFNQPFVDILEKRVRDHLERGLCKDIDPSIMPYIILSMLEYCTMQWVNQGIPADKEELVHNLSIIIFHTLNH
ncbi:MAG: TetR/AcrR family transcriptional regulator [Actinomycetota bacterium]|nr:TetR/AcrR family transcriptional regulator [Actinomycetota bacterium]